MPSEGGYLEAEGIEKTWRIKQEAIVREVDISSSKNQYDIVLPGQYLLSNSQMKLFVRGPFHTNINMSHVLRIHCVFPVTSMNFLAS